MFRNIPFLKFMVKDFSLKIKSASSNFCEKSSNSPWMKMAKISLPKGSGKRLKVREKSVKSQGILKWILSGNPGYSHINPQPLSYSNQSSNKLWKSWKIWKITNKKFHAWKKRGMEKNLNNDGKIMEFCEII